MIQFQFYEDELSLSRKEVDLLKGELRLCKETFMRSGAAKAVEAMESVYRDQMTKVEGHHTKIIAMMRRRLEELADCLQVRRSHVIRSFLFAFVCFFKWPTLCCQLEDTVLIGTLLLFDPGIFPKYEA